jgi:tetratricopeptide (TPR) repeat protein
MQISFLEERLAANLNSPLFARLASLYLLEGDAERAIGVCVRGLKQHPDYATAHLVLARCYEAAGRNVEALLEYRRVLKSVPDNTMVQTLLRDIEQREQEAFQAFAEEQVRKLKEKRSSLSFENFVSGSATEPGGEPVEGREDEESGTAEPGSKIATATLAEIYSSQGQYGEAILVYRRLVSERPDDAERYTRRIEELQVLDRMQREEAKE